MAGHDLVEGQFPKRPDGMSSDAHPALLPSHLKARTMRILRTRRAQRAIVIGTYWLTLVLMATRMVGTETTPVVPFDRTSAQAEPFEATVQGILRDRCEKCHGDSVREGGLDLRSAASVLRGGDSGPAVIPRRSGDSLLVNLLRADKMPPEGEARLTEEQIRGIARWIDAGAVSVKPEGVAEDWSARLEAGSQFWSFQPPRRPEVPAATGSNAAVGATIHPIDAFLQTSLDRAGLDSAPVADRRTLIRRATIDLIGLPPTPKAVEAFVNDSSDEAWSQLLEQLLRSPQYGERWARHWLDVARYADTGGYETDIYYKNAWRYRDYVVKSLNDDKPYDRFVQEQLAGDELWPDNLDLHGSYAMKPEQLQHFEALTGTGFFALGPQIHESNMDAQKLTLERLTDWVDTTSAAFMGLTLGCARCHDHKFDPISQRDYYALQAVFSSSKSVEVPMVHAMGVADFRQHYPRLLAVDEARQAYRLFEQRTSGKSLSPEEQDERRQLLERIANAVLALPASDAQGVRFDGLMEVPTVTVLGHEREELVPVVRWLARGDLERPRDPTPPALPAVLARNTHIVPALRGPFQSRKELALWLTRPDHPLTARVMVNRIWQWHFGQGLVTTPNDFGKMGAAPSHPELLDWLATEFVAQGWSIKAMHRLMMTSHAYRQSSSNWTERHANVDPENRLLWRMNRRRLEAETLWDTIHSVAGTLNLKMGGRPVLPPLAAEELTDKAQWIVSADPSEHTRRGIYILVRRNFRFPLFDVFDVPVNAVSCAGRDVSTVAPQALWLMNNSTAFGQAQELVARLVREAGTDEMARVQRAWYLVCGRPASDAETHESLALIRRLSDPAIEPRDVSSMPSVPEELAGWPRHEVVAWTEFCLTLLNLSEFLYVD